MYKALTFGNFRWGLGIALREVFVFPALMWIVGGVAGVDGRVAFYIGFIINQISEFSLVIAAGLNGYMVFSKNMYLTIVVCVYACVCVCVCNSI